MQYPKFILIKSTGNGFWFDMHNVLAHLYLAEITEKIPVVYWGRECLYSVDDRADTFSLFFQPVSQYSIYDLENPVLTFFPQVWNSDNLRKQSLPFDTGLSLDELINCNADVVVQNGSIEPESMGCIERQNMCGFIFRYLYGSMLKKYIRLQPQVSGEIDDFYESNMKGYPLIAVHIRGSDKIVEVEHLFELNGRYPGEINRILKAHPRAKLFLMTDCSDLLERYTELYPGIIINTECKRVLQKGNGSHFQEYEDRYRKGLEIVMDTWLAARCDYFIGNGYSNVSMAVSELKDWDKNAIKLLY